MDLKLAGKVALITGSSRGIVLATAKAFVCWRGLAVGSKAETYRSMGWNNPTRLSIGGHFNVWRCPISGSRDRVVLGSLHDRGGRVRSVIAA